MSYLGGSQEALVVKNLPDNAGDIRDAGSNPGLGRSPEEGNGDPVQYPCLERSMDRGAQWAVVHGVAQSQTRLSTCAHMHYVGEKTRTMKSLYTFLSSQEQLSPT